MNDPSIDLDARRRATQRVTGLGTLANILLAFVKIIAGYIGHSHALLADGIHSLADLIADGAVLLAAKYGNQAADHNHPYGHQRIETVTCVFIAIVLLATAVGIMLDAYSHLQKAPQTLSWYVLWIAFATVIINEWLYRYTLRASKRYHSPLLKTHAWHRRSDAAASSVVCIGIIGTLSGIAYLDSIAAIIMAALIVRMAYQMGRQSLEELMDQGLDEETLKAMTLAIQRVDGVRAMHQLRTRSMAGSILADVHIIVDPHSSVSEGHYIADRVYQTLKQQFQPINDIIVHVDPEDDEVIPRPLLIPSRQQLQAPLQAQWSQHAGYSELRWLNWHYLNQSLEVSIALPLPVLTDHDATQLHELYQQGLLAVCPNSSLSLYFYKPYPHSIKKS